MTWSAVVIVWLFGAALTSFYLFVSKTANELMEEYLLQLVPLTFKTGVLFVFSVFLSLLLGWGGILLYLVVCDLDRLFEE